MAVGTVPGIELRGCVAEEPRQGSRGGGARARTAEDLRVGVGRMEQGTKSAASKGVEVMTWG